MYSHILVKELSLFSWNPINSAEYCLDFVYLPKASKLVVLTTLVRGRCLLTRPLNIRGRAKVVRPTRALSIPTSRLLTVRYATRVVGSGPRSYHRIPDVDHGAANDQDV